MTETPASSATKRSRVQIYDEIVSSTTNAKRSLADLYTDALEQSGEDVVQKRTKNAVVDAFDLFYKENASKLHMPPESTHPRNEEAIQELQQLLSDGIDRQLGELIAVGLTHISFARFYEMLCKNAYEAVVLCRQEKRNIHLFVSGHLYKSNIWCSLLVWPIIRPYVTSISGVKDMPRKLGRDGKVLVLQVDDAIYSGSQMATTMQVAGVSKYTTTVALKNTPVIWGVLVAAATQSAESRMLQQAPIVKMIGTVQRIETLEELIERRKRSDGDQPSIDDLWRSEWRGFITTKTAFRFSPTLVYFDHKMPDYLSTNGHFLLTAPLQSRNNDSISVRSLITGCPSTEDRRSKERFDVPASEFRTLDTDCPATFYKSFTYTVLSTPTPLIEDEIDTVTGIASSIGTVLAVYMQSVDEE